MKMKLPNEVKKIIAVLEAHGHEAYAVGGCVRDTLMGRVPNDWDVTTSAKPQEVKKLFPRTVDTGIQHGTVTVMFGKTGFEVTTYRIDGVYKDKRHPESVTFTDQLSEDLLRRDFTINAMAYNETRGIRDYFGGQEDLAARVIRAVGVPEERFREDALRILRCVRFAAQLDFSIDEKTLRAAKALAGNLKDISKERVREEFVKILVSAHPEAVGTLSEIGAVFVIEPTFPERQAETLPLLMRVPADEVYRLAAFLRTTEAPDRVLRELKFDNKTRKAVDTMIAFSKETVSADPVVLRHLMRIYGKDDFGRLLVFYGLVHEEDMESAEKEAERILKAHECVSLSELAVKGEDLKQLGIPAGQRMGEVLNGLLEIVLNDPEMNEKEKLFAKISQL